jgi:hypothetical protein
VVAKEGGDVRRSETHNSTFLINVFAVCSVVEAGVENSRVSFASRHPRLKFKRVILVGNDPSECTLSGDTHRPRAHVA